MTTHPSPLDIERPELLIGYLKASGRIGPGEIPRVETLAGGVSNRTVLVTRESGEAWVLKQALAKLRVDVDWFSDPSRIRREALGLRWLEQLVPGCVPAYVFEDHAYHLLAMQAVPQPHQNWKARLLRGEIEIGHVRQFGALLGSVHRRACERQDEVADVFADRSFFETLRLEPYYAYSAEQVPASTPFLQRLIEDTRQQRHTLVHGDYSPKNVLVYREHLILLDFEVIHFGDPAFDLGFSLTHLLSKAHHLPDWREAFIEAAKAYWQSYREELSDFSWAKDLEPRAVRHTLGCLLARVAGRSKLEYLSAEERTRQRELVLELMTKPPTRVVALADAWLERLPDARD